MNIVTGLSYVNLVFLVLVLFIGVYIWTFDKRLRSKIDLMNEFIITKVQDQKHTKLVVDETYRPLYIQQTYDFRVEDYFVSDIYKDIPEDQRSDKVQDDFFIVFTTCIDTILRQKKSFEHNFQVLSTPTALQYNYYLPVVKCAKYSIDYDSYLRETDQRRFILLVENMYRDFSSNDRYFALLDNGKCKKHIHVLYFIERAIELYRNHRKTVDDCLYYGKCKPVILQHKPKYTDTCSI